MPKLLHACHALLRRCDGVTAVEFAIVGPIFLVLVCSWIELGMMMLTQSVLDNATRDAARLIRTRQVAASAFTSRVCSDVSSLIPCASIEYNVVSGAAFSVLSTTVVTNTEGDMTGTQYSPGTHGDNVVVQVGYNRSFVIPWIGQYLGNNNKRLLVSTVVFQNE